MRLFDWLDRHFKLAFAGLILVAGVCIAIVIFLAIRNGSHDHTFVSVSVAPSVAKIIIGNEEYGQGIYPMKPGKYQVVISAEGFDAKEMTLEVKKNQTAIVSEYLMHKTEGLNYYIRNAADLRLLEAIATSGEAKDFLDNYQRKVAIKQILPLDVSFDNQAEAGWSGNNLISVELSDGSKDKRCTIAFCLLAKGRKISVEKIKEVLNGKGYKYEDYEVILDHEQ